VTTKVPRARLDSARIHSETSPTVRDALILQVLESVSSTNDAVLELWAENPGALLVACTADEQTAGRGRLDRTWMSPFGAGVALSLAFPAKAIAHVPTLIPLHFGVLVAQVLEACGAPVRLKWPNDIVMTSETGEIRKLGGILATKNADIVVVGIGLNFSLERPELPTETASSLSLEGFTVSREEFIGRILSATSELLRAESTDDAWLADYVNLCSTLEREVMVHPADGVAFKALATGIDEHGGLVILREGSQEIVTVGDIVHLR